MKDRTLPVKRPILFLLTLLCAGVATVHADTITVRSTGDGAANPANCPGTGCRLRDALAKANAAGGDTINFSVSGTITLTNGQLVVNKGVAIDGPGANLLAVNGNASGRVFSISSATVTISDMTITNGRGVQLGDGGGMHIDGRANVTLSNCTVTGNSSDGNGGGIFVTNSDLTLTNCVVSNNSSASQDYPTGGGGIYISGTLLAQTTATINNSTISGNSAHVFGGGLYNDGSNGNPGSFARLVVNNSTITGNSAVLGGGAIYNDGANSRCSGCGATATVGNSTISGNSNGGRHGSGILNFGYGNAIVIVKNSTIVGVGGNCIRNSGRQASVMIGDTILGFSISAGGNIVNTGGSITSLGYNLSTDNGSGVLTGSGDQVYTDPQLSILQNNGGPTLTHAPLPGSAAIDHGNPGFTPPPGEDQRGCPFTRVFNTRIDVGSIESQPPPPPSPPCPTPRPRPTPPPR